MADRMQFRRDTAANWTAYNPILLEGELGFELDTDQYKLGDGIHNWGDLPYRGMPCVQQIGQSTTTPMSQKAVTDNLNKYIFKLEKSINSYGNETNNQKCAILESTHFSTDNEIIISKSDESSSLWVYFYNSDGTFARREQLGTGKEYAIHDTSIQNGIIKFVVIKAVDTPMTLSDFLSINVIVQRNFDGNYSAVFTADKVSVFSKKDLNTFKTTINARMDSTESEIVSINKKINNQKISYEQGSISVDGELLNYDTAFRTGEIPVDKKIRITINSGYKVFYRLFNSENVVIDASGSIVSPVINHDFRNVQGASYVRYIVFFNDTSATMSEEQFVASDFKIELIDEEKGVSEYKSLVVCNNTSRYYTKEFNDIDSNVISKIFYKYQQGSLNTSGNINNLSTGYVTTDFIPAGGLVTIELNNPNSYPIVFCGYDSNKTLVKRFADSSIMYEKELDFSDCAYLRLSIYRSSGTSDMTLEEFIGFNIRILYINNFSVSVISPYNTVPQIPLIDNSGLPEMKHIIMDGQSLSTGYKTEFVLPKSQPSNNAFMFMHVRTLDFGYIFGISREAYEANPDYYDNEFYEDLKILREEGDYGNTVTEWKNSGVEYESPCSGIAEALYNAYKNEGKPDIPFRCLFTCPGEGATKITEHLKGTEIYNKIIKDVTKANALCKGKYRYSVGYFCWCQGESTSDGNHDSVDWYKGNMSELFTNLNSDIKEITNQKRDIQFISYQTDKSRFYSGSKLYTSIAQFEYQADNYVCAFPIYHLPKGTDHLHLTALSSRKMGNLYGYSIYLKEYYDLKTFKPESATVDGNNIVLKFDRDIVFNENGLSGSDVDVSAISTNKGFISLKNSVNIVTSVSLTDSRTITISCSETPVSLKYGYDDITAKVIGGSVAWDMTAKGYENSDILFYMPIQEIAIV